MTQGFETKVSSFDEYWNKENVRSDDSYHKHKETYELGAESRQGEIDEIQKKYDAMYNAFVVADDCRKEWHRCYVGIRQREDELQKKIDDAINCLEQNKPSLKMEYKHAINALSILKGE